MIPRQRVLVISTGSELVTPGTALRPGQIYESNSIMLAGAVRDAGAELVAVATAGDDVAQFSSLIDRYAADSDLIITSGGVSAGAYEVVKDAFGRDGDQGVEFVKVAMQPGMPQGGGRVAGDDRSSRCPATRSARWCPSRCSSGPRCARPWACRIRNVRTGSPSSPSR